MLNISIILGDNMSLLDGRLILMLLGYVAVNVGFIVILLVVEKKRRDKQGKDSERY